MNIISTDTEAQSKNFNGVYHNILSARNSDLNDYALNYLNDVSEQLVAEHNGVLNLEKARDFVEGEENG